MPMALNTKKLYINSLVYLARHHNHKKTFKEMTPENFFSKEIVDEKTGKKRGYLENLKRTFEEDIEQKWVNTYNNRLTKYIAFYKWLTQPELKREERQPPPQLKGFRYAKRKSKTSTRREHMWTDEEHRVFLKYCEDKRLACFHAIAKDTGARPSELLALKISDLQLQTSPSTGKRYAQFTIGDKLGGKMKKPRPASISDAIPYFNVWVHVHPLRDVPQGAYLFPSADNKARYRNLPLNHESLRLLYVRTLTKQFPKVLDRPDVPLEDKVALKGLIYDKNKHRPYLRRHEFSSEIHPKVPQSVFNQLLGHSKSSRQYEIYTHELGDEGIRELQIARGIISRDETISPARLGLQAKYCPICHEANKQEADFCFKCNWVISKKGIQEVREKDEAALKEAELQRRS
jgi:integrase